MTKKILLATFTLQGGGAERCVLTLANAYAKMGYETHVMCFKNQQDYPVDASVKLHFLNYQRYRWMPKGLRNRVFSRVFDAYVNTHIGTPELVISNLFPVDSVLRFSHLPNTVFVIHNTLSEEYQLAKHPQKLAILTQLYTSKPCICVSEGVKQDFIKHINNQQVCSIHNPIDKPLIKQLAEAGATLDLPAEFLVHVGSFKHAKAHDILLKSYAKTEKNLPLVLLGQGPLLSDIQQLAAQLEITEKVIFAGFQANPYSIIKRASGMVLASRFEGFGLVIAEAQALGVPVISTDCPSGPAELLPKTNLVAVEDINALANKLKQLMLEPKTFITPFNTDLLPQSVASAYLAFMKNLKG